MISKLLSVCLTPISFLLCLVFLSSCLFGGHDHGDHDHHESTHSESGAQIFSDNGDFSVIISYDNRPIISGENSIELTLKNSQAEKLALATISASTWMPMHNHGSSPDPVVEDLGNGEYSISRINFTMDGRWKLILNIEVGDLSDVITIPFTVEP